MTPDFSDLPTWSPQKLLVVTKLDEFTVSDVRKLLSVSKLQSNRIVDFLRKRNVIEKVEDHKARCILNSGLINVYPNLKRYKPKTKYRRTAIGKALAVHIEQQLKAFTS